MDVFSFRDQLVADYEHFTRSFARIRADDIRERVDAEYAAGRFWPAPLIHLNPAFLASGEIGELVAEGLLHPECLNVFRAGKTSDGAPGPAARVAQAPGGGDPHSAAARALRPH